MINQYETHIGERPTRKFRLPAATRTLLPDVTPRWIYRVKKQQALVAERIASQPSKDTGRLDMLVWIDHVIDELGNELINYVEAVKSECALNRIKYKASVQPPVTEIATGIHAGPELAQSDANFDLHCCKFKQRDAQAFAVEMLAHADIFRTLTSLDIIFITDRNVHETLNVPEPLYVDASESRVRFINIAVSTSGGIDILSWPGISYFWAPMLARTLLSVGGVDCPYPIHLSESAIRTTNQIGNVLAINHGLQVMLYREIAPFIWRFGENKGFRWRRLGAGERVA